MLSQEVRPEPQEGFDSQAREAYEENPLACPIAEALVEAKSEHDRAICDIFDFIMSTRGL